MKPGYSILFILLFLNVSGTILWAQQITAEEYILTYKDLAIKEMQRSGIPASITLAQGMLESENGNSTLAKKANNHFGIKCHNNWQGKKIHHNDDKRHECFRKYRTVYDSYADHTDFLMNTPRYAFLFDLDPTDYKGWARGLKKAGYATNPQYADKLINLIEDNNLHQYDLIAEATVKKAKKVTAERKEVKTSHQIYTRNRIKYIKVKEGDSFESLTRELGLLPFELYKYNDLHEDDNLIPGQVLYIQPKRNRAAFGNHYHVVKEGETLYDISQMYGVKLSKLYQKNNMSFGEEPEPGQKIFLRKRAKETKKEENESRGERIKKRLQPEQQPDEDEGEPVFKFDDR